MAYPYLQFASLETRAETKVFSTASNTSTFIRVRADYVNGTNTATVVNDVAGYFGTGSIETGYYLRSPSEVSSYVKITDWNPTTKVITFDGTAEQDNTNQLSFIALPEGKTYILSASFSKAGGSTTNPPRNLREITGSEDPQYQSGDTEWGVIGLLAHQDDINTGLQGLYQQYILTSVERETTTNGSFWLTSSNTIEAFKEPDDYYLASEQAQSSFFLSEKSGSFLTIAGASDIAGGQALGLAGYQQVVGSSFPQFATSSGGSSAGFPFTGSAEITGSLGVTGSVEFIKSEDNADFFLIKSGSFSSFKFNNDGVGIFGNFNSLPTAVAGGFAYSGSNFYAGIE